MNDVFEDLEKGMKHPKEIKEIKITAQKDKTLSKEQQTFNRLTKRISTLQDEIVLETEKCERLLTLHTGKIPKLEKNIAERQLKLAKTISRSTQSIKYGKRQLENIECVILHLFDQAFAVIDPDNETELLYNQWAGFSYQEKIEKEMEVMKQAMAEMRQMMESLFGFKMDADLLDFHDSPESFVRSQEKEDSSSNRKKSKKELEKELRRNQEEAMKLKSMRNIYISLVKVLHPDTETDPLEIMRKEELMKKVTGAYDDKDLTTLLKLEIEWVASEAHNLDLMTKDKLKIYIASLKEQVKELENEKASIWRHPRAQCVRSFAGLSESMAVKEIDRSIAKLKKQKKAVEDVNKLFSQPNPKKAILSFVTIMIEQLNQRSFKDDLEDLFSL